MKNAEDLSEVSTYFLILELLESGEAGLVQGLGPESIPTIILELESRTGMKYGEKADDWAKQFLQSKHLGSELERANLMIFLRTRQMMSRISNKQNNDGA
jgi:hypothetical protein